MVSMHPKLLYGTGLCKKKDLACFEKLVSVHTIMRGHRFLFSYPAQRRRGERGVRARTSEGQFEKPVSVHNVMRGHQFLKVEKSVFRDGCANTHFSWLSIPVPKELFGCTAPYLN